MAQGAGQGARPREVAGAPMRRAASFRHAIAAIVLPLLAACSTVPIPRPSPDTADADQAWARVLATCVGFPGLIVAFGDIVDYRSSITFGQHVLSVDTTFSDSPLRTRAIADSMPHRIAYAQMMLGEALTGARDGSSSTS